MIPLFTSPKAYRRAGMALMALNIGNIVTFGNYFANWTDNGEWLQGVFVIAFHLLTILALSMLAGRFACHAKSFDRMIKLMEGNGFIYDPDTKEFRPGTKQDF
ncbi:hypothetical protein ACLLKL_001974 [Escherichia coli]